MSSFIGVFGISCWGLRWMRREGMWLNLGSLFSWRQTLGPTRGAGSTFFWQISLKRHNLPALEGESELICCFLEFVLFLLFLLLSRIATPHLFFCAAQYHCTTPLQLLPPYFAANNKIKYKGHSWDNYIDLIHVSPKERTNNNMVYNLTRHLTQVILDELDR